MLTVRTRQRLRRGFFGGRALAGRPDPCAIAYEPVWAIGTGLTASTEQAGEVHAQIRALLTEIWGEAGSQVRIIVDR